ncbi:hypothetical protein IBX28_23465 [Streptomyces sp. SHP 1-2]|nr:hypothetical protein [Streptomyces sp. SHP 1-2]
MRGRPDTVGDADMRTEGEPGGRSGPRRIDLSVPQVAGSALAAVVAAKLASSFGVYGTILGAGLISVVATCGGSVLQHVFRRTGERMRDRTVPARTATARTVTGRARAGRRGPGRREADGAPAPGEYTEGTVHRTRGRSRRRQLIGAALVFGVAMTGITVYEVAAGHDLSGDRSTTIGGVLSGHDRPAPRPGGPDGSGTPEPDGGSPAQDPGGSATPGDPGDGGATSRPAPSATPGATAPADGTGPDSATGTGDPAPDATGGATGTGPAGTAPEDPASQDPTQEGTAPEGSATTPGSGADGRSGTAGPGPAGPAAP